MELQFLILKFAFNSIAEIRRLREAAARRAWQRFTFNSIAEIPGKSTYKFPPRH